MATKDCGCSRVILGVEAFTSFAGIPQRRMRVTFYDCDGEYYTGVKVYPLGSREEILAYERAIQYMKNNVNYAVVGSQIKAKTVHKMTTTTANLVDVGP